MSWLCDLGFDTVMMRFGRNGLFAYELFSIGGIDGKPASTALAAPAAPVPSSTGNAGKNTVDDMRKVLGRLITAEYLEEALACTKHIKVGLFYFAVREMALMLPTI